MASIRLPGTTADPAREGFGEVATDWRDQRIAEQLHDLDKRRAECGCLRQIIRLSARPGQSLEDFLRRTAELLPFGWQYPEFAHARVTYRGQSFESARFQETQWRQAIPFGVGGTSMGAIEVFYGREFPPAHEGPFLKEERQLIEDVAAYLSSAVERWHAASRVARLDRAQQLVRRCNKLLVRARIENELIEGIARTMVEGGGYALCCIGFAGDDADKRMVPAARFGAGTDFANAVQISWGNDESGNTPIGAALRSGKITPAQNLELDTSYAPWREGALSRGFRSCIAVPLIADGRAFAVMGLYATETDVLDEQEEAVLEELAGDVAYAISALRETSRRRMAESAGQATASELETVIANALVGMVLLRNRRFVWVNDRLCEMTGYSEHELVGATTQILYPSEQDYEEFGRVIYSELGLGQPFKGEHRFRRKDGSEFWARLNGNVVPGTEPSETLWILEDVTDHKRTELALRESQERFRLAVEGAQEGIFDHNLVSDRLYQSPRVLEMFGLDETQAETKGMAWFDLLHPDDRERMNRAVDEYNARPGGDFVQEVRMRHSDGHYVDVLARAAAVRDASGRALRVVGTLMDISDEKRTIRELEASERQYQRLVEKVDDWVWQVDADLKFTYSNPRSTDLLGYEPAELIGKEPWELMPDEEARRVHNLIASVVAGREPPQRVLSRHVRQDGAELIFETNAVPILDDDGNFDGFLGINRDVTERLAAEMRSREHDARINRSLLGTISALARTIEARDPYTAGHQNRVGQLAVAIGEKMGLPREQLQGLEMAAAVHDIGKIYVPGEILTRPGKITPEELALIRTHPAVGYQIVAGVEMAWPVADVVRQHHERIDGSGYPQGLRGNEICLEARIVAVADVVEAMSSHRPYRPALPVEAGLEEVERYGGVRYDSDVVDACIAIIRDEGFGFEEIGGEVPAADPVK